MAAPHFPSRGHAPDPPPLVLNWAAGSLRDAVETRSEAQHWNESACPAGVPVLTGHDSVRVRTLLRLATSPVLPILPEL